jgi:nucleotide-binding universal stress UspA family protein
VVDSDDRFGGCCEPVGSEQKDVSGGTEVTEQETQVVVVGTDGSEHAERALSVAAEEAERRGASIRIVTAWHVPSSVYGGGFVPMVNTSIEESTREAAERVARAAAEELRERGLEVETKVCHAQAADALVEESEGADVLIVGSRGHGGFSGLLLGSVSQQCAHHAHCPTMIVR